MKKHLKKIFLVVFCISFVLSAFGVVFATEKPEEEDDVYKTPELVGDEVAPAPENDPLSFLDTEAPAVDQPAMAEEPAQPQ